MNAPVESSDRTAIDLFNFGLVFFGFILAAAGVVTLSIGVTVMGGLISGLGILYYCFQESK
jgi:hypothetical protein